MDSEVLEEFSNNNTAIIPLEGGQNTSVKVGNIVIKPITDKYKYLWLATELEHIIGIPSLKIVKPILSKSGYYLVNGYGATEYVKCRFHKGKLKEKIRASNEFHKLVSKIKKPVDYNTWTTPWSIASQIAWEEKKIPNTGNDYINKVLLHIHELYKPLSLKKQFIHSDLAGNILFSFGKPVIIDISPEFRPVEYATTLIISDSIAWHGADERSVDLLPYENNIKIQLLLRSIMFRLCVPLCFSLENIDGFKNEVRNFSKLINKIDNKITSITQTGKAGTKKLFCENSKTQFTNNK